MDKKLQTDALQGWISGFLVLLVTGISGNLSNLIPVAGVSALTSLLVGALPGVLAGKFMDSKWGAYIGGAIIPLLMTIF